MDKKFITKENKTAYVKLERIVLDQLDHPGIVRLYFTFQDSFSLCKYIWVYFILNSCFCRGLLVYVIFLSLPFTPLFAKLVYIILMLSFFPSVPFTSVKTWHLNPAKVENFLIK